MMLKNKPKVYNGKVHNAEYSMCGQLLSFMMGLSCDLKLLRAFDESPPQMLSSSYLSEHKNNRPNPLEEFRLSTQSE